MTKRDYVRIVRDISTAVNLAVSCHDVTPSQARAVASHLAHVFARTERGINRAFDQARFFAAVQSATGADMAVDPQSKVTKGSN